MLRVSHFIKYDTFLALFAFLLPINEKLSTLLIGICAFVLLLDVIMGKASFRFRRVSFLLPALYCIYIIVSILMSNEIQFKWFENKASLIVFPLLFATSHKIDQKKVLSFFVYGCLTAYTICLLFAIKNSVLIEGAELHFSPVINGERGFFEAMVYEGNYFFGTHFSRLMQISYFALYLAFAISALWFRLDGFKGKRIVIFILSIAILQTTSLAGIVNLITVAFIVTLFKVKSKTTRAAIVFISLGLILASAIYHPRVNTTIIGAYKTLQGDNSPEYPVQPRLKTWQGAIKAVGENGIFGVGIENAQKELNTKYEGIDFEKGSRENLNAHNQYLQILVECGILGLVILFSILAAVLKRAVHFDLNDKLFVLCFFLLISLSFMFESMLSRYIGVSFFAFFVSMIFCMKKEIRPL